ncbi:MAG: Fic family protein [Tannerellaceae bacterium]|nr:Fic family protein [Tannerellaceae bacterium]
MVFEALLNKFNELHIADAVGYERMNEIFISHHSTAIEGSSLTEEESRLLIEDGITAKGKPLYDHNMVKDHFDTLGFVVEKAKEKQKLTPSFIQQIPAHVMHSTGSVINAAAGNYDSSKGDWRKSAVHVGARYFTNYQKVEREVTNLCEEINKRLDTVVTPREIYQLAFDAHYYLVSIHPFADGNGRVSRLLMNYILAYHNMPLATIFTEDKLEYYKALEESRAGEETNLAPIRDFLFSQQEKYFRHEIEKYEKSENQNDIKFTF